MIPEQLVDQLHRVLVDEIRVRRPEYLRAPFTVAEIYQELVPYRTHRDRIGASMNGDYEHALLRLLAGEGDYLRIESEPARKRMAEELGSSNPNTGLFREFAALDVRLNPALIPIPSASAGAPEERAKPMEMQQSEAGSESASGGGVRPPAGAETKTTRATATAASSASAEAEAGESCRWCREALPRRANLRFCPYCGTDVNLVPCPSCGEEVEPGWRFCIACGTEVASG